MDRELKRMRQRCEKRLRTLELPVPFDVQRLCNLVAQRRGRPIVLKPLSMTDGPCGLWIAGPSIDVIFYEQHTSRLHQDHIILHEVCHIICDHYPTSVSATAFSQLLFPDLRPEMVHRLLQRANYSTEEEREAELLATLILGRTASAPPADAATARVETSDSIGHLEGTLQDGSYQKST